MDRILLMFIDDALFRDMWRGFLHCSSRQTVDYMAKQNYLRLISHVLATLLSVQACLL